MFFSNINLIIYFLLNFLFTFAEITVEPSKPSLYKEGIGDDHFNISFVPGHYDSRVGAPVGNSFYVKYRETDSGDEWLTKEPPPDGLTLQVTVDRLIPGTKYDVMTVSLQRDEAGNIVGQTESRIHHITTTGVCKSIFGF